MVITSAINIDMQYKYVNTYVDAVQYDVNSRNVEITLLKAGSRASFCRTGCSGTSRITPTRITSVVTMALVATLMVEMISCSGVPTSVPAISFASTATQIASSAIPPLPGRQ